MMKRNKAILCALASIGFITSVNTVSASAMTMNTNTTTNYTQYTVSQVENLMYNLPYTIDVNKIQEFEEQIDEAKGAYESLAPERKDYVDKWALSDLKRAESLLKTLKDNEEKAKSLVERINKLKEEVQYKGNQDITKIEVNTNILKNKKEEIKSIREVYNTLDYSFRKGYNGYTSLVNVYDDFCNIECKLVQSPF